ncbi:MAG: DNA polymerase domain-containing protein [Nitrospirota bacterium]
MDRIAEYCLKDSELTLKLGELILPQVYELSKLTGQLLFNTSRMMYSQLVEWHLSKKAYGMKTIIPNNPKWSEIGKRMGRKAYIGGFVKEPVGGLHEKIAVMDFKSLYPSIIATFNISPETFNCSCCKGYKVPERDYWFCKKKKGFVPTVIEGLINRRDKLKRNKDRKGLNRINSQQLAVKTVSNAMYGYFGFYGSKWYCYECAESAAAFGRFYIKKVIDEAEKEGFTVVYGDTDSLFVTSKNLEAKVEIFLKKVNKDLPGIIKLDLQGIYKRGIFIPKGVGLGTAKKRYALIDKKGTLTVRGLEKVRRDWSNVAKNTQEKVLRLILEKKDVKGSIKYVRTVIRKLKKGEIPLKDLVIIEQLTKPLADYKKMSPHVSAARKMKERGNQLGIGMPILFVITKGKGSISDRAEPFEDVKIEDVDINYYINNQIMPASLRVLKVLDVREDNILNKKS